MFFILTLLVFKINVVFLHRDKVRIYYLLTNSKNKKDMKALKKTVLSIASDKQDGGRNNTTVAKYPAIKLKAVTSAERQRLRISSYQYILP